MDKADLVAKRIGLTDQSQRRQQPFGIPHSMGRLGALATDLVSARSRAEWTLSRGGGGVVVYECNQHQLSGGGKSGRERDIEREREKEGEKGRETEGREIKRERKRERKRGRER